MKTVAEDTAVVVGGARDVDTTELGGSSGGGAWESEEPDDGQYAHLRPLLVRFAGAAEGDPVRAELRERLVTGFLPIAEPGRALPRPRRSAGGSRADRLTRIDQRG